MPGVLCDPSETPEYSIARSQSFPVSQSRNSENDARNTLQNGMNIENRRLRVAYRSERRGQSVPSFSDRETSTEHRRCSLQSPASDGERSVNVRSNHSVRLALRTALRLSLSSTKLDKVLIS